MRPRFESVGTARDATCTWTTERAALRGSARRSVREIRLHDTRPARCGRSSRATPARSASTPAGRRSTRASTSATRARSSSSPCSSASSSTRGYEATLVANITDINDKIYDAARAAGRQSAELAREMTAALRRTTPTGSGSGGPTTSRWPSETSPAIVDLIAALVDGGHAYEAGGDVYFRVRSLRRATASSRTATSTRWTRARASRAPTARRTRSTSRSGRRTSPTRTRPGTRPGAAAAPAGTSSARRWPSSCSASTSTSTAAASTSCSRTTRTRRRRRWPGAASRSRASGCTTGCSQLARARRCPSRSATSAGSPRRSTRSAATR